MKSLNRESHCSRFFCICWLNVFLLGALSCGARAATYQVSLGGTLYYTSGNHWDNSIQIGTPFSLSLTYSTPPAETYNFTGYSTHVFTNGSATMQYQVGTNMFAAGRVDVSIWNDMLYSGSRIDGYHLATDTGSSPGFDYVEFYVALQSSNTNLLSNKLLPLSEYPVAAFDKLALAALRVNFAGYDYPDNLGYLEGGISSFSITEIPEPSAVLVALLGLVLVFRESRAP